MQGMLDQPRLTPPIHALRSTSVGPLATLQMLRGNALAMWGRQAYELPAAVGSLMGRMQVLLNEPEAIGHVLVRNGANYRRPVVTRKILAPLLGEGLLLSEGPAWKLQRRTIAPTLSPRAMPVLTGHVARAAAESAGRLAAMAGPVELLPELQRTALDIAGRSMFSLEMAAHGKALRTDLTRFAMELSSPSALDMLLPQAPNPRDGARRRFRAGWIRTVGAIVAARDRAPAGDGPRDLLDLLRDARDPETGQGFTPVQLCDQVATMILAGHETTALALFWSLCLVAQAPFWQQRIADEAAALDLGPANAAAAMDHLPVTRAVVSEALRLYPPAFLITREAIARDVAHRTLIPRGATVAISPWVLHRHSMLWAHPHSFDPHRFMPGVPPPPRFAYLPFGAGPRICVAAQFAMNEAMLVLATLVRQFRFAGVNLAEVRPFGKVTTQPDRPAFFSVTRR